MRFLPLFASLVAAVPSVKRGLVYTPNSQWPQDNQIWLQSGSDLSFYYNYGPNPSPEYANVSQSRFEYVPMMWGIGDDPHDTTFYDGVVKLINGGRKITHVLGFNEPDGPLIYGGSDVDPYEGALAWIANFIPLRKLGVKIGLPAPTGAPAGLEWLHQMLGNCTVLTNFPCEFDFATVHWYDNIYGLKAHTEDYHNSFPSSPLWVTEFNYAHQSLEETQKYYYDALNWLDTTDYVERYTMFAAFRSKVSNVGENASFLNNEGQLTDIGSDYLGFGPTGVIPTS